MPLCQYVRWPHLYSSTIRIVRTRDTRHDFLQMRTPQQHRSCMCLCPHVDWHHVQHYGKSKLLILTHPFGVPLPCKLWARQRHIVISFKPCSYASMPCRSLLHFAHFRMHAPQLPCTHFRPGRASH